MILYALACVVAGLLAGFLGGLFGVGGGIVLIPFFVFIFGQFGVSHAVVMHLAVGTSLALVVPTSIAASWKQWRQGNLDVDYYQTWALGIFVGVIAGSVALSLVSTGLLESLFIGLLLLIALYVGFFSDRLAAAEHPPEGWPKGVTSGLIGFFSVLLGLGGGVLTTPTMRACSYPLKKAIALSSATGLVVGGVGALGAAIVGWNVTGRPSWSLGYIDLVAFSAMLIPVLLMAPVGAAAENRLPERLLRWLYALFLVAMAAYMMWDLLR
jgi:uncharacterized protein